MSGKKLIANIFDGVVHLYIEKLYTDTQWTDLMGDAIDHASAKLSLRATRRRPNRDLDSGENLSIDVMLFDKAEWNKLYRRNSDCDAFILPKAVIELENMPSTLRLEYCLWKLLCVRSPVRILICYQPKDTAIMKLTAHLRDVIIKGNLMKNDGGEVYIVVGNESVPESEPWERYWQVYEWYRAGFQRIDPYL